jgi:hypothetical protein
MVAVLCYGFLKGQREVPYFYSYIITLCHYYLPKCNDIYFSFFYYFLSLFCNIMSDTYNGIPNYLSNEWIFSFPYNICAKCVVLSSFMLRIDTYMFHIYRGMHIFRIRILLKLENLSKERA